MKSTACLGSALAALASLAVVRGQGFSNTCCEVGIADDTFTLTATCRNNAGGWQQTSIDLNECMQNLNGNLSPWHDGAFGLSCSWCGEWDSWPEVKCPPGGSYPYEYGCECAGEGQGNDDSTSISLDSVVSNWDGALGC